MWKNWALKILGKFSVTAMLREQLALSDAQNAQLKSENDELKAKIAVSEAELKLTCEAHDQTKQQYQRLQKEHEEEVRTWRTVEFRRGKRTFREWAAFCPKCKMPVHINPDYLGVPTCSGNCGWTCGMTSRELLEFLKFLENPPAATKR